MTYRVCCGDCRAVLARRLTVLGVLERRVAAHRLATGCPAQGLVVAPRRVRVG